MSIILNPQTRNKYIKFVSYFVHPNARRSIRSTLRLLNDYQLSRVFDGYLKKTKSLLNARFKEGEKHG
jgi:hypothetical protein